MAKRQFKSKGKKITKERFKQQTIYNEPLKSTASPTVIRTVHRYRKAAGFGVIKLDGRSTEGKSLRNNIVDYTTAKYGTYRKKAELIIMLNIDQNRARQLSKPGMEAKDVNRILNNFMNRTISKWTKLPLNQMVVRRQTAAQFASENPTEKVQAKKYGEVYDDTLQQLLAISFQAMR